MSQKRRFLYILILILCSISLFLPLQSNMGQQLTQMLTVTLSVYAILRGLNGVISVAQGTELSIEPMGVGLTLTPGELLDPLNDLIEQVSTILLFSSASLGIQQILLALTDIYFVRWILAGVALVALFIIVFAQQRVTGQEVLVKVIVVLTLLRLMVPAMVVTSSVMQSWLEEEREQSVSTLVLAEQQVRALNNAAEGNKDASWFKSIRDKLNLTDLYLSLQSKTNDAVTAAVAILAEFLLVFIFIPLLFLAISYKLIRLSLR